MCPLLRVQHLEEPKVDKASKQQKKSKRKKNQQEKDLQEGTWQIQNEID